MPLSPKATLVAASTIFASVVGSAALADDHSDNDLAFSCDTRLAVNATDMNVYEAGQAATVSIRVDFSDGGASVGSGTIIGDQGHITTNSHVIAKRRGYGAVAEELTVTLFDPDRKNNRGKEVKAAFIGKDPRTDVAVLKIDAAESFSCAKVVSSGDVRVGDHIFVVGAPIQQSFSVDFGTVANTRRYSKWNPSNLYYDLFQTNAPINSGNSGGPMFDQLGNVIGTNVSILSRTGENIGIGYTIPSDIVMHVADELIRKGEIVEGWAGLKLEKDEDSRTVAEVLPESPADFAGVQVGDELVEINGREIYDAVDVLRAFVHQDPGDVLNVIVARGKEGLTTQITLGDKLEYEVMMAAKAKEQEQERIASFPLQGAVQATTFGEIHPK